MMQVSKYILKAIVIIGFIIGMQCNASSFWPELFQEYETLFNRHPELELIKRQQAAFAAGQAPAVAHPDITCIPIVENHEKLVNVRDMQYPRIVMMPDPIYPFESDACNSGLPSSPQIRESIYNKLIVMIYWLDILAHEYGYESNQFEIRIFEGLRDLKTQELLFNNKKAEIMAAHPDMTDEQAEAETSKWVSPIKNNVPVHSTGAAVDIRIWDRKEQSYLDVGKFGVIWGANPSAPTFSEDISDAQKRNRLYFLMAGVLAGFTNYQFEHWHVSAKDRVAAFWNESDPAKRVAYYGPVA